MIWIGKRGEGGTGSLGISEDKDGGRGRGEVGLGIEGGRGGGRRLMLMVAFLLFLFLELLRRRWALSDFLSFSALDPLRQEMAGIGRIGEWGI